MKLIELVIRLPKEKYDSMKTKAWYQLNGAESKSVMNAIQNGIPISPGHGALKDADAIRGKIYKEELFYGGDGCEYDYGKRCGLREARELVESAQTIIEADKEDK